MRTRLRVGLLIESSRAYGRALLRGIGDYARTYGPWSFYQRERLVGEGAPRDLVDWGVQGILARIESHKLVRQIQEIGVPTVDLFGLHDLDGVPVVECSHRSLAQVAADHLLERGFEHFGYCGFTGVFFSDKRCDCFVRYLADAGYLASVYGESHAPRSIDLSRIEGKNLQRTEALAAWIRSLPKPVGIMTCNDVCGQHLLDVCHAQGIAAPEDVAVVGVDNDDVHCRLCVPPLSSIDPNVAKIGYEAAGLLHRMMTDRHSSNERIMIEPLGVVTRQSTDVMAIADADVARAVHFIRDHACDGIIVHDVAQHTALSRSTLERRFLAFLGRSPSEEIVRVQVQRIETLLKETDFPLAKIADLAGFDYVESMCRFFKRKTGRTPGEYRKLGT